MNRILWLLILTGCNPTPKSNSFSDIDKMSFQKGYLCWEKSLQGKEIPYNLEQFIQGIYAAEKGAPPLLTDDEFYSLIHKFQDEAVTKLTENNLLSAELFLKNISIKNGVVELVKNKLYYERTQSGSGDPLMQNTPILASYTAKVLRKNHLEPIFQSEHSPMEIYLEDTIPGFSQGIAGILEGEERTIYIHPDLGYGASAGKVDPNQLIVLQVSRAPSRLQVKTNELIHNQ